MQCIAYLETDATPINGVGADTFGFACHCSVGLVVEVFEIIDRVRVLEFENCDAGEGDLSVELEHRLPVFYLSLCCVVHEPVHEA